MRIPPSLIAPHRWPALREPHPHPHPHFDFTPPTHASRMLQEGALLRDALLRMRADEACISHLNGVLADLSPGAQNPFITMSRKSK